MEKIVVKSNKKKNGNLRIVFFSTPAYGHMSAELDIIKAYVEYGAKVYVYATKTFEYAVGKTGATFIDYAIDTSKLDMTVGSRLVELEDVILHYVLEMSDRLIKETRRLKPDFILHDNVAMWGRVVAGQLHIPAISLNSFPVVPKLISRATYEYTKNFAGVVFEELFMVPTLWKKKLKVAFKYPGTKLSMIDVIVNREDFNVITFPRYLQPGYKQMRDKYYFPGPTALNSDIYFDNKDGYVYCPEDVEALDRIETSNNIDSMKGANDSKKHHKKKVIFVSLGTIFQQDVSVFEEIVRGFGNSDYVVIVGMSDAIKQKLEQKIDIPDNFIIKPFVKQCDLLEHVDLFISAGGNNSISQAVHRGVPCLMYPQQGEQQITSERTSRLGLGKILQNPANIRAEAEELLKNYNPDARVLRAYEAPDYGKMIRVINKQVRLMREKR